MRTNEMNESIERIEMICTSLIYQISKQLRGEYYEDMGDHRNIMQKAKVIKQIIKIGKS